MPAKSIAARALFGRGRGCAELHGWEFLHGKSFPSRTTGRGAEGNADGNTGSKNALSGADKPWHILCTIERPKVTLARLRMAASIDDADVGLRLEVGGDSDAQFGLRIERPRLGDQVIGHVGANVLLVDEFGGCSGGRHNRHRASG